MARLVIPRAAAVPLAGAPAIYLAGVVGAILATFVADDIWIPWLFAVGAATALFAWHTIRWPDGVARYFAFGAILLLACAANRLLYIADYLVAGPRLDDWPFPVEHPELAIFKGEVLTVAGTLITVLVWVVFDGLRLSPAMILANLRAYRVQLAAIYLMSLAALLAMRLFAEATAGLGLLLPTLHGLGMVSGVLYPLTRFRNAALRVAGVIVLSIPFIMASAGAGMKEEIIVALLPVAAIAWAQIQAPLSRAGMVALGVIGVSLITSYVGFFRDAVWRDRSGTVTTGQAFRAYATEFSESGAASTISDGWTKFIWRSNASVGRAWSVAIADEQQFQPELVFGPLVYVFVPRVVWPDKPQIRQGWEYSGLVFGPAYIEWSESSTAAGFYTSLYLGYGWLAFFAGAILAGYLIAKATIVAQRFGGTLGAGLYIFTMVHFALRMDEQWTVGVFASPIITLAYVLLIVGVTRLFTVTRH